MAGKSDEMLRGEFGFVLFHTQLSLPASDLADGKNDPATSDALLSLTSSSTFGSTKSTEVSSSKLGPRSLSHKLRLLSKKLVMVVVAIGFRILGFGSKREINREKTKEPGNFQWLCFGEAE